VLVTQARDLLAAHLRPEEPPLHTQPTSITSDVDLQAVVAQEVNGQFESKDEPPTNTNLTNGLVKPQYGHFVTLKVELPDCFEGADPAFSAGRRS
jgi:hypothetical protein